MKLYKATTKYTSFYVSAASFDEAEDKIIEFFNKSYKDTSKEYKTVTSIELIAENCSHIIKQSYSTLDIVNFLV